MMQRMKNINIITQEMSRVNYINEKCEADSYDENEEQLFFDGIGTKPFYMERTMSGNYFKAIIDTELDLPIREK